MFLRAFALLLLLAFSARADDIRPRVILSWETRDSGGMTTTRLRQDIDVFLSRALTETIALQMILGANHYDLAYENSETRALELRPSGTLRADFGSVHTETTWALRRSRHEVDDSESRKDTQQIGARVSWPAAKYTPGGMLRAYRYRIDDREQNRAILNDQLSAGLDYAWNGLTASATQSYRLESDSGRAYERQTTDTNAGLGYNDTFSGGKLSVNATATGNVAKVADTASQGSRIPTFVPVMRVLWGVDDTPLDSSDHPLSAIAALYDNRTEVSTGIDFGPDGASFQAIAFDIGRVSPVDEIQIVVRDERLEPVTVPDGVRFDVYTSIDGERWTLYTNELVQRFDSVRSQYEIGFEQTDVRWIKAVSFGATARPTLVTEATLQYHRVAGANAGDSDFRTLASTAAIQYSPLRSITVGYNGSLYQTEQKSGDALQSDVRDVLHAVTARFEPRGRLAYDARYEIHDVETDRTLQSVRAIVGSMRFSPRPQLLTTLMCDRREEETEISILTGRTCTLNVSARVFPTLDFAGGISDRHQQLSTGGAQTTRMLYAVSNARVTKTLRLVLQAALNRSNYENWTGGLPPPSQDDRFTAEVDWNRGRALGLGATLTWVRTPSFSGVLQRYRVRWSPFGDGAISIITNYTQDIDPYTDGRSERLLISPRWQINAQAALNVTYSSVVTTGPQDFESSSLLASLILGR